MKIAHLALVLIALFNAHALADVTIYQSAQLGPTDQSGGVTITPRQFLGVRFQITNTVIANEIGGHFGINDPQAAGNKEIFGALIALPSADAFPPLPTPLSGPGVIATATFPVPYLTTDDVAVPIPPVTLNPGWYAVMFGSGQFGATAIAIAPQDNPPVGSPSFFAYGSTQGYLNNAFSGTRFFVADVSSPSPEPASVLMMGAGCFVFLIRRNRRNV